MNSRTRCICRRAALGAALLALAAPLALAQSSGLGTIHFPNSGHEAAQQDFLDGVRLLHSFEWEDAAEAFQRAQAADPDFALAYWGEALSHTGGHHYPPGQDMSKAREALLKLGRTRAERVAQAPTDREKQYLESVHILYGPGDVLERSEGYEQALAKLSADYPDDLEAAAFHSLALMRTKVRGEESLRVDMRAGAIAQRVFRENPDHPGAAHYVIHAFDNPVQAPVALYAAEKYADIAPAAVHALHMPSHIFLQHGMWDQVRGLNDRSYQASVVRAERKRLSPARYSYHALYWLLYAYLQEGRYQDGQMLLDEFEELTQRDEMTSGMKETWMRMDALNTVETRRWKPQPVDDLVAQLGSDEPTVGHRTAGAMIYARGASAAETGDVDTAMKAHEGLRKIHEMLASDENPRGAEQAQVMAHEMAGLIAKAKGDREGAIGAFRKAVTVAESMEPPSGPPGESPIDAPIQPAHELLGELLLDSGDAEEALQVFEVSLERTAKRPHSLYGAARAAAAVGDEEAAADYYEQLLATPERGPDLPGLADAEAMVGETTMEQN